jgi:hypothetical protein
MTIDEAVVLVRTQLLAQRDVTEAQQLVLSEALRWRSALRFYANPESWIDGTAVMASGQDDGGSTARYALRLDDYAGQPIVQESMEL